MVKQFYQQHFVVDDLTRLPLGQTLVRTLVDGAPTSPFNMATMPPPVLSRERQKMVEEYLQNKHARPRKVVEAEIAQRLASRPPPAIRNAESLLSDLRRKAGQPTPGLFTENWLKQKDALKQNIQKQKGQFEKELLRQKELEKRLQRSSQMLDSLEAEEALKPKPIPPHPKPTETTTDEDSLSSAKK